MKNIAILVLLTALSGFSCSSTLRSIFDKKTPHEAYAADLDDNGLEETPEGRQWLAASQKALETAQLITLPYRQEGVFGADKARALGLKFHVKFGEQITFTLAKKGTKPFVIFADVFKQNGNERVLSADTATSSFQFAAPETGTYVLRLQPQLYHSGEYSLAASVGPSLGFPVSGKKAKAGSFWGASRDGGKRKHEGIDIFAPKGTPAIAAADGYISGVREGGIGGKTVWLRTAENNVFLYYAHLDKQLVEEGQAVKRGDVLGWVGNTGNAKYTPAHLHFGIYTYSGPVDPLPFVNQAVKKAPAVAAKNLAVTLKLTKSQKAASGMVVKANTILVPLAVTAKGYIAELPDGNLIQASFASVQAIKQPAKSVETAATKPVGVSKGS